MKLKYICKMNIQYSYNEPSQFTKLTTYKQNIEVSKHNDYSRVTVYSDQIQAIYRYNTIGNRYTTIDEQYK